MKSLIKPLQNARGDTALPAHWSLLRCRLLWAYDRPLKNSPRRWDYVFHPTGAWFVRRGAVRLHFPGGSEHYASGQWVFPRHAAGEQEFTDNAHILSLRFLAEWPNGKTIFDHSKTIAIPEKKAPFLNKAAADLVAFVGTRFARDGRPNDLNTTLQEHFQLQSLFFMWLAAYHRTLQELGIAENTLDHFHEKLRLALYCLNNQLLSEPLRERELARQIGWSVSHLNKTFIREIGKTPTAFWNERRLNTARSKLVSETESIKAIAYELGFSTPENFSHWFRLHAGQPPRDYRRMNAVNPGV